MKMVFRLVIIHKLSPFVHIMLILVIVPLLICMFSLCTSIFLSLRSTNQMLLRCYWEQRFDSQKQRQESNFSPFVQPLRTWCNCRHHAFVSPLLKDVYRDKVHCGFQYVYVTVAMWNQTDKHKAGRHLVE